MNKCAPNGLGELCASKNKRKHVKKGQKFPASETYTEKIVVVYVGSAIKPLTYHFENYTQMYKTCFALGITNKSYYQFVEGVKVLSDVRYEQQSETYTFTINALQDKEVSQKLPALPVGHNNNFVSASV